LGRRYDIAKRIGNTGFGDVFLGTTEIDPADVVHVELVHRQYARTIDLEALREAVARTNAASDHPGVVVPVGLTSVQGRAGIVTRPIEGIALGSLMVGKPWPARAALELVASVADVLDHTWDCARLGAGPLRWAHGDMNPNHIRLQASGALMVTGFGYDTALRPDDEQPDLDSTAVFASLAYMAPERLQGGFSQRVDLYSLGIILYELVTGARLAAATSAIDRDEHNKRVDGFVAAAQVALRSDGEGVAQLIREMLSHDPMARPQRFDVASRARELKASFVDAELAEFAEGAVSSASVAIKAVGKRRDHMLVGLVVRVVEIGPATEDSTLWATPARPRERIASGGIVGLDVPPEQAEAERRRWMIAVAFACLSVVVFVSAACGLLASVSRG